MAKSKTPTPLGEIFRWLEWARTKPHLSKELRAKVRGAIPDRYPIVGADVGCIRARVREVEHVHLPTQEKRLRQHNLFVATAQAPVGVSVVLGQEELARTKHRISAYRFEQKILQQWLRDAEQEERRQQERREASDARWQAKRAKRAIESQRDKRPRFHREPARSPKEEARERERQISDLESARQE